ncbi:MAG: peptide deformylase [Rhizobacter sp.]|nr:peptide deformylase [Bacteriovorax sp.]
MTARKVIRMGHPTLRLVAELVDVSELKTPEFIELLVDMYDTMKVEGGIGIAAPQINVSKQVTLIELPDDSDRYGELDGTPLMVIINPKITYLTEDKQGFWEGCLSVPGLRGFVERPNHIQVDYINEHGEPKQIIADEFLATVFQHELDHLFGKLYIDRITDTTKITYTEEFSEFIKAKPKDTLDE